MFFFHYWGVGHAGEREALLNAPTLILGAEDAGPPPANQVMPDVRGSVETAVVKVTLPGPTLPFHSHPANVARFLEKWHMDQPQAAVLHGDGQQVLQTADLAKSEAPHDMQPLDQADTTSEVKATDTPVADATSEVKATDTPEADATSEVKPTPLDCLTTRSMTEVLCGDVLETITTIDDAFGINDFENDFLDKAIRASCAFAGFESPSAAHEIYNVLMPNFDVGLAPQNDMVHLAPKIVTWIQQLCATPVKEEDGWKAEQVELMTAYKQIREDAERFALKVKTAKSTLTAIGKAAKQSYSEAQAAVREGNQLQQQQLCKKHSLLCKWVATRQSEIHRNFSEEEEKYRTNRGAFQERLCSVAYEAHDRYVKEMTQATNEEDFFAKLDQEMENTFQQETREPEVVPAVGELKEADSIQAEKLGEPGVAAQGVLGKLIELTGGKLGVTDQDDLVQKMGAVLAEKGISIDSVSWLV